MQCARLPKLVVAMRNSSLLAVRVGWKAQLSLHELKRSFKNLDLLVA